eukprot:CAMPEP_0170486484 /NCGR_PEP_ID=MMETSP0208-20121228/5491_1 /TAXON_ID=197538 /ORGANISM="Strombidium inclinatum, Strain S3" /LENGTH=400 /DNA_ID=CAMNT_0010760441 /DNA_START=89 /DNA_END=1291 /DNA_ORIENTATION=+
MPFSTYGFASSTHASHGLDRSVFVPLGPGLVVLYERASLGLFHHTGVEDDRRDDVGVDVRGGSSVLDVALSAVTCDLSRDAEGASSVADGPREGLHAGSLVEAGESLVVVRAIELDVGMMPLLESYHHIFDVLHSLLAGSHSGRGEVGVAARAIPVGEQLGVEADRQVVLFRASDQQVASGPEVVTLLDTRAGPNLELPLARHDLGVGTGNLDAGIQASFVVSIGNGPSEGNVTADRAVVGALVAGVARSRPAIRAGLEAVVLLKHGVLLLNTEPGFLFDVLLENLLGESAEVGVAGHELRVGGVHPGVGLAQDHDVVSASEGVGEEEAGLQDHLGVFSRGLVGRRAVKVPVGKLLDLGDSLGESPALRAEAHNAVDPDVLGDDLAVLIPVSEEIKHDFS